MLLLSLSNLAGEIILPTGIKHIKLYHIPPKQKELAIGPILALYLHGLILVQIQIGVRFSPRQPRRGTMGSVLGRGRLKKSLC